MTKEELIEKLKELHGENVDAEHNHGVADNLLLEFINDEEVTEAFEAIKRWYA